MQNLEVLYRQYGRDGSKHGLDWQEVAVCIVQDGIESCHPSVLAASTVQGFFSELLVQDEACGLPVSMHMFEYTARYTQLSHAAAKGVVKAKHCKANTCLIVEEIAP